MPSETKLIFCTVFGTQTADEAFNDTSCVVVWNMQTGLNVKMMHRKPQLSPAVESCDHYWDYYSGDSHFP